MAFFNILIMFEKKKLRPLEEAILAQLSNGSTYKQVEASMLEEFKTDLSGRKLTYRINEARDSFEANSHVHLGYLYAHRNVNKYIEDIKQLHQERLVSEKKMSFQNGVEEGLRRNQISYKDKVSNRLLFGGVILGLISSWIYNYIF